MSDSILVMNSILGGYRKIPVVSGINLKLDSGTFLGIIGPNGSGKSTLLRLMSRVLIPFSGTMFLEGRPIQDNSRRELSRKIACVSQDTASGFSFAVKDIVSMGRTPYLSYGRSLSTHDVEIVENAMRKADVYKLKNKNIDQLSAGERQRVFIAKALAQEPRLLLLDEPTSHMDIGHQIAMLDLLKSLNREYGLTVVVVMHDLNMASEYCEKVLLLESGNIVTEGTPGDVLTAGLLESIYRTKVVMVNNPVSGRPCIIPVSKA